jgi:hypothetical protein
MSETLESLMGKLVRTRKEANIDLEAIPSATRGAWTVRVNTAKAAVEDLETRYRALVLDTVVAVPTVGPKAKAEAFGALVEKTGEGFMVDAQGLYAALTAEVEPLFGASRQWGMDQTLRLRQALKQVLEGMGISSIMTPDTGRAVATPDAEATQKFIRDSVRAANGDDLNVLYLKWVIGAKALAMNFVAPKVPVFLVNVQPDDIKGNGPTLIQGVFGDRPVTGLKLREGDEVDEAFMFKTFESLDKKSKK